MVLPFTTDDDPCCVPDLYKNVSITFLYFDIFLFIESLFIFLP